MKEITLILSSISILFFILLGIKEILKKKTKKFCAICGAVSITWVTLLILYFIGLFNNKIIIALLIGGSVVGVFYSWEHRTKREKLVFRLPLILSLFLLAYFVLIKEIILESLIFLVFIWDLFLIIYSYRKSKKFNLFIKKIIECCKRW